MWNSFFTQNWKWKSSVQKKFKNMQICTRAKKFENIVLKKKKENVPSHQKSHPPLFFKLQKIQQKTISKKKFKTFEDEQSLTTVSNIQKWKSYGKYRS